MATSGSIDNNSGSDIGNRAFLISCYDAYVGKHEISHTYPLTFSAENLPPLPRTLITIGDQEMLLDQSYELAEHLRQNGTRVNIKEYKAMFHSFWNLAPNIKEADILITDVAAWVNKEFEKHTS